MQRQDLWDAEAKQYEKHLENWNRLKPAPSQANGPEDGPLPPNPTQPSTPLDDFEVDADPCRYFFPLKIPDLLHLESSPAGFKRAGAVFTTNPKIYLPPDRFLGTPLSMKL